MNKNNEIQFSKEGIENLFTLPEERLVFSTRKHLFVVIFSIINTIIFSFFFIILIFFALFALHMALTWFFVIFFVIFSLTLNRIINLLVDWYFHIYIITTSKIVEFCYNLGSTGAVNEILLDQVRCTEIDVEINGTINQLLDKGNIIFTFDRPTHQEEFKFSDVSSPKEIRHFLSNSLNVTKEDAATSQHLPIWYKGNRAKQPFRFIEEISSRRITPTI